MCQSKIIKQITACPIEEGGRERERERDRHFVDFVDGISVNVHTIDSK